MAYIEKEKLALDVQRFLIPNTDNDGTVTVENAERYFLHLIGKQPAADVVEVIHGEWHTINEYSDGKTTECTACNETFFFMKKGQLNIDHMPYCPKCGAKMDGGNNDGTSISM